MTKLHRAALLLSFLLLTPALRAQGLGLLPVDSTSAFPADFPSDLNSNGDVASWVSLPNFTFGPARFDLAAAPAALPILPGDYEGNCEAINAFGDIVGVSSKFVVVGHSVLVTDRAVRWNGTRLIDLTAAVASGPPYALERAYDINDRGQVVGKTLPTSAGGRRAFLLDAGRLVDLGLLPGVPASLDAEARALNEVGQVVGACRVTPSAFHAVLWQGGVATDLHDPTAIRGGHSAARDINERGEICGAATFFSFSGAAPAFWDANGNVRNLGNLGGSNGEALALNDFGDVVGVSETASSGRRGFLYRDGVLVDLNDLIPASSGWLILEAMGINNAGWIAARAASPSGVSRGVLLVPNPCTGFFDVYASGCTGSNGTAPVLAGFGCPRAGEELLFVIQRAQPRVAGVLLFGTSANTVTLFPGCSLQILPLLPVTMPVTLATGGRQGGELRWRVNLPQGLQAGDVHLQALLADAGSSFGVTLTNPLRVAIR